MFDPISGSRDYPVIWDDVMHELAVTESILNVVLKHANSNKVTKVVGINLRIGELSDLQNEWVQRYFDYLSKGTLAEGALLKIERSPIVFKCQSCGSEFQTSFGPGKDVSCPQCGSTNVTLIRGREFFIKDIEVV
ncbi:MAG: hydrogenase maturation nickel metallochaperone HypA [Syntrophales bacterium]|jgi:hydrogenase nickel incorporation protein HypA/HybF